MVVFDNHEYLTEEEKRLKEDRERTKYWKKWGPYVAERQWATGMTVSQSSCSLGELADTSITVREDYSADGDAWSRMLATFCLQVAVHANASRSTDFPHDHSRSRAYRWGEDGIAGVSDTHGLQNIAFAFWNEKE